VFGRKKHSGVPPKAQTVPKGTAEDRIPKFWSSYSLTKAERELYSALRESVPIIDAAIGKIIRLIGGFGIVTGDRSAQKTADEFIKSVSVNSADLGLNSFVSAYLDSLLTYGEAVGEMIPSPNGRGIAALYNASLDDVELTFDKNPLDLKVCRRDSSVTKPVKYQQLVVAGLLNQKPGKPRGTSILAGLPFVASVMLRILESLKTNWERIGDVRFAVTYNPGANGVFTEDNARQIADEWKKAMRSDTVCDFVSLGDVSIKAIGADNRLPDCEVPVRVILEQIVSKLGIPPFLLGLSWSSTERMSAQQADILTSELEYYRRAVEPAIRKTVDMHLRLSGYNCGFDIVGENINLQDEVELSQARLNNAHAMQIESELDLEEDNE
jgi:hypothetical protein